MKKLPPHYFMVLAASIISATFVKAQTAAPIQTPMNESNSIRCGQADHDNYLRSQDPDFDKKRAEMEKATQEFIAKHPTGKTNSTSAIITIPTVVHVVWNTAVQNIPDSVVHNMINMLNQNFGRTNPNANETPDVWKPIAANMGIQFCLAQRDPSGASTNGIVRVQTGVTSFEMIGDGVKSSAFGGSDAWNTTQYFNIWLCGNLTYSGQFLYGYGEFPTNSVSNTWGAVLNYGFCNTWMTTHEVGHAFNLNHVWGDDGTACSGSDWVNDTPNQAGPTGQPCPPFPHSDVCNQTSPNGCMFMNYMDYAGCPNLFTQGQSARCNAVLNTAPYNALTSSLGCLSANLAANDAGITLIKDPSGIMCPKENFNPVVIIRNWGSSNLVSCMVSFQIDANPVQTYNWSGNLASLATATVTLNPITATAGTHTFTCYTTQPNATADLNNANDISSSVVNVMPSGQALPLVEGFEAGTFPPTGWTLENPDAAQTWGLTTAAAKTGSASMLFGGYCLGCGGGFDIMQTPNLDLTSMVSQQVTFQVAYQMWDDPNPMQTPPRSDSLGVDVSTDCGKTWTNLYFKYGTDLFTTTPSSATPFVPTQNDWRLETINLAPYASNNNILLRWKVSFDYDAGNRLYVDDINITGVVGTNEYSIDGYVSVFPNPSSGMLNVNLSAGEQGQGNIKIYNVLGAVISEISGKISVPKKFEFDLSEHPNGIYFVEVKSEKGKSTKKFVLNK